MITRASDALYDTLCPGRALAQDVCGEPDRPEELSDDAKFGTTLHHALSKNDPSGLTARQQDIYDSCQKILAKVATQFFGTESVSAIENAKREYEYCINVGIHSHMGHPDAVLRSMTKAMIPDFKTLPGQHDDASGNMQLRDYVAMVFHHGMLIKEIATVIIQPLVTHSPEVCVYTEEDSKRALNEMMDRVGRSLDPNSPRLPGDRQCKFCRAKPQCREYQAWIGQKLPVPKNIMDVPVAQWTPEQRAIFMNNKDVAQKWLDDTEASMVELMSTDKDAVTGWELKPGANVEVLTDLQTIYARFTALGGKHEEFMDLLKGVRIKGGLEELVAKHTQLKGKELKQSMKKLTDGASEYRQNKPSPKKVKNDKGK